LIFQIAADHLVKAPHLQHSSGGHTELVDDWTPQAQTLNFLQAAQAYVL
jgi:hypothetical protein